MPPDTVHPCPSPRPTHRPPTAKLPWPRGLAYLDDAAAPRGRPRSLQEGGLAVRRGPRSSGQGRPHYDSPSTGPQGPPPPQSPEVASGPTRGSSSLPAASGGAGASCWLHPRPWPSAVRAPRGEAAPGSEVQPLGTGALLHREAARPDFVSPPGCSGGGGGGGNFLERRRRSSRDVRGLWSRRLAVRGEDWRGGGDGGEDVRAGGRRDDKERRCRNVMHTPALRQTKAPGAWPGGRRGRDARGLKRAGARRPLPGHPPPARDRGAAAPGVRRRRRPPLRSVVTGREDLFWQPVGIGRRLGLLGPRLADRGSARPIPTAEGVPEHEEWNVFSNWEPAQQGSCTRVVWEHAPVCVHFEKFRCSTRPWRCIKIGGGVEGRGKRNLHLQSKAIWKKWGVDVSAFGVTSNHQALTADSHL